MRLHCAQTRLGPLSRLVAVATPWIGDAFGFAADFSRALPDLFELPTGTPGGLDYLLFICLQVVPAKDRAEAILPACLEVESQRIKGRVERSPEVEEQKDGYDRPDYAPIPGTHPGRPGEIAVARGREITGLLPGTA